jgi:hypothetical protein
MALHPKPLFQTSEFGRNTEAGVECNIK